jgi:hypothetical protein
MAGSTPRTMFSLAEAGEIRGLLDQLSSASKPARRVAVARLRRMGLEIASGTAASPTRAQFEQLVSSEQVEIDLDGDVARASIQRQPLARVFKVSVGVTGESIPADWNAFDQRYQWFGKEPRQVTSGAHLFVLAVDRWKSAIVGLYEAVSSGAQKLPGSSNPDRWPWALGVRPLAAISPPEAGPVVGQTGPQNGLPAHIPDEETMARLYEAVAYSRPAPGPETPEQRVQELEWEDVLPDVLEAVASLGKNARGPEVVSRALELGGWSAEQLEARAWYTGSGVESHIELIVGRALRSVTVTKGLLDRTHGVYSLKDDATASGFGVAYRPAANDPPDAEELPKHLVDLTNLDRATRRHMELQDRLAKTLHDQGIEPLSPGSWQPQFDIAFEHEGKHFVVEVKSGDPVSPQQLRLGAGQLLEYRYLLQQAKTETVQVALLIESEPPGPWGSVARSVGIELLQANKLEESLSAMLSSAP